MSYKALHDYIKDTCEGLGFDITFFHGRVSNAQQIPTSKSVNIWLFPMQSTGSVVTNTLSIDELYNVNISVYKQDKPDSGINRNNPTSKQGEIKILETTSNICDILIRKLSNNDISNELQRYSDLISIESFSKDPAIKDTSKYLTGFVINMTVKLSDNFDYCCK